MFKRKIYCISKSTVRTRRRSIVRDFALTTSAHGIPGIARSRSRHNRLFWTVSFVTFVSITLIFVGREIRNYFEYPTQTSVQMNNERPQYFPAFTICNLAPVRYDRFIRPFINYTNSLNLTQITGPDSFSSDTIRHLLDFFQMKLNRNESLDQFFFPLSSMLIRCVYNGKICSAKDFTSFSLPTFGFCYTFNAKMKGIDHVRYTNENGRAGSLYLRFYVHHHQYVPFIREGIGMIATVHDNRQLPLIDLTGMALAAGFKHRITYTKKTISYLRSPYSNCNDKIPLMMRAMFNNYQPNDYSYSADLCYDLCTQAYVYLQCGCIDPMKWHARTIVSPGTDRTIFASLCDFSNACYSAAASKFLESHELMARFCSDCPPQCSVTNFQIQSSLWKAPPSWLINETKTFVENNQIPLPNDWSENWRSHIESDYLSIELIHESSIVENYTQTATMTAVDVLSNVGGQTGLWIGVSFLSLMEVAEMLYRLIRHQINLIRQKFQTESKV